jgi:hypothetical protein
MQAAIRRVIDEVEEFEVESTQQVANGEGETFPATFGILGFESPTKPKWERRRKTKAGKAKTKKRAKPSARR